MQVLNDLKFNWTLEVLAGNTTDQPHGFWQPYWTFTAFVLLFGFCAGALVSYIEVSHQKMQSLKDCVLSVPKSDL